MFTRLCLIVVALYTPVAVAKSKWNEWHTEGQFSGHLQSIDGYRGWGNRSPGKFIDGVAHYLWQADLEFTYMLSDTWSLQGALSSSNTDFAQPVGVTEAYIHWRPVPNNRIKHAIKAGSFYPPISLENSDSAWHSPFTTNFSAINTWIAEEVRVMGIEFEHSMRTHLLGSQNTLKLKHAFFMGNDPAGSLLAWKGWSIHQRQSVINDELPLAPLPVFEPGQPFSVQADYIDPFVETDDQIGYYASLDWNHSNSLLARFTYYDNRADPLKIRHGQYGWRTRFYAAGIASQWSGFDIVAQLMNGDTRMGPRLPDRNAVDNQFASAFLLISKQFSKHRMAIRRDWFEVKDRDSTSADPNQETGSAWTLSYAFLLTDHWTLETEYVTMKTRRLAWALMGEAASQSEKQVRLGLTYRL